MDLYAEERKLRSQGYSFIAGVDEVGRGCLAGPVFAAAVILPADLIIPQLNDSKKLTSALREKISVLVHQQALAFHIDMIDAAEIDRINILRASLKAMQLAVKGLSIFPKLVLVDGHQTVDLPMAQKTFVGGDGRYASIAAASVIAKVARDRYMAEQEKLFPQFSFGKHKGYGTSRHLEELKIHGPTVLHRRSFAPVRATTLTSHKLLTRPPED